MGKTKIAKYLLFAVLGLGVLAIYYQFNPSEHQVFPKCPLRVATGYECPGCGSQRALHCILNGDWKAAFSFNPLLVLSIPYLLVGFALEIPWLRRRYPKTRHHIFGYKASLVWAVIAIGFWIGRNLW